jgi:hypothetical protein
VGEEGGIPLWVEAVSGASSQAWTVHGPPQYSELFTSQKLRYVASANLNLDTEIRYHLTPKLHAFVEALLDSGETVRCRKLADELNAGDHRLLLARDLDLAKDYLRERYENAPQARYGLLASSKDKWLPTYGVDNTFQTTKRLCVGPWYNADSSDDSSCCQLSSVATEFSSQGLELDCALLAWGSDYVRKGGHWSIHHSRGARGTIRDPAAMRRNVYRVLLTRGRDGTVIYVPPIGELEETAEYLIQCGFRPFSTSK